MDNKKKMPMRFAAIGQHIETNLPDPSAVKVSGKDWVFWGADNAFPQYVAQLRDSVPSLSSIISGFADYICGDDVLLNVLMEGNRAGCVDRKGTTLVQLVRGLAEDLATYNGFALEVIRSNEGGIAELVRLSMDCVRIDKDAQAVFYSEKWADRYNRADNIITLPVFSNEIPQPDSVLYVKADNYGIYPQPTCQPALIACELERGIDEYHLNSLNNSFMGSWVINFNNGTPSQEEMDEVERTFNAKFSGKDNAGRCVFIWNESIQNRTTMEQLKTEDFGTKYEALAERSRQQIFTAFRANPNLFGIPTASGFNSEEYESSFKLFNRTMVRPMQRLICDSFDKVLGVTGSVTFKPFSLETETETNVQ